MDINIITRICGAIPDGFVKVNPNDSSYVFTADPNFNPILQVKQDKRIWDLWHHFSDSKYNKIFHKDSDFKKFNIINIENDEKIIQFNKKLG